MKENPLRAAVEKKLSKFFDLYPEVYIPETKGALDLIVVHKENPSLIFGIEFKNNEKKTGYQLAQWCKQMAEYSRATEYKFTPGSRADNGVVFSKSPKVFQGRFPILACPPISHEYLRASGIRVDNDGQKLGCEYHPYNHDHSNVNSFLSAGFNVGEVRNTKFKDYPPQLRFVFANRVMWREWAYKNEDGTFTIVDSSSDSYYEMNMKAINKFHHE